ncbi:amidohydrolase family protein [Sphingomonas sp.]|uniref:amidohydrolase family protein n=1 Tax=Sphingomonas sp. TaxID=28214 RepID=UPI002D80E127|nr:amidohydrolase family protein [Sphingomonas sp.]HEU0044485.1 amidohydrolase family protein [Sphingomonas sp.]
MRIDVHAHYFPQSYTDKLVSLGLNHARGSGQSEDLTGRLKTLDENHCDHQILSAVGLDTQVHSLDGAVEGARFINDLYAETVVRSGGRFRAFGWVPLPYVEEAITEAIRCLDELRFEGICFPCFFHGRPLDDPAFEPFWAELNRRKAKAYIHPVGAHSCSHPGMAEYNLSMASGSLAQLQITAQRIVYSGLSMRFPDVEFIFAVCGGHLPYVWERTKRNLVRGLTTRASGAVAANFYTWMDDAPITLDDPMQAFRKFWYDTSVQDIPEAMLLVQKSYGTDRLLLGSDEIFASLTEAVSYVETNPYLSADEKVAILDRNAQSLFNL